MKGLLMTVMVLGFMNVNGQAEYKANFLKKWENAAAYTIECAEAMPADKYDYKPTEEARTFRAQLLHMVGNMMWLSSDYLEANKYGKDIKDQSLSKDEVLAILRETFQLSTEAVKNFPEDRMTEVVEFFAGPMEIQQIMMLMTDHMTHHRGQILVYLRLNEVKAPRYRGW